MRWGKSADYLGVYGAGSSNAGVTYVHANPKYIDVNRWDYKDNQGQLLIQNIVGKPVPGAITSNTRCRKRSAEGHLCRRVW